jgi:superfamily II DNA or RNA helicase
MATLIRIQNCYSWLFTDNEQIKFNLWCVLRFREKGYVHSRLYKQRLWDGFSDFFSKKTGRFLTGLLPEVELALKQWKEPYTVEDEREKTEFAQKKIDSNYLNQWLPKGGTPIQLYDYQVDFVNKAIENKRGIVFSQTSSGKAQPLDSIVYTPSGPKKMGEIKKGDTVCTPDNGRAIVLDVFPQGLKEIYEIVFRNNDTVRCCKEHLWKCINNTHGWKTEKVKDTAWLIKNLKSTTGRLLNAIPNIQKLDFETQELPIDPYIMGLLLGDGRFHKNLIGFSNTDKSILDYIRSNLHVDYSLKHDSRCDYYIAKKQRGIKENIYLNKIRELGLSGKRSYEKHIPDIFKYNSYENRIELIRGIMDTDGTVGKTGEISLATTSKQMAYDFKEIVNSLGFTVTINEKYKTFNGKDGKKTGRLCYIIYIKYINDSVEFFKLPRKLERVLKNRRCRNEILIKEINYVGIQEAKCILLDSKDHMYVTDNCIQTHNTEIMISILKALPQNCPTLLLANRTDLVAQNYERLSYWGFSNIGRIYDKFFEPNVITCATVQSLHKIESLVPKIRCLVVDEVHDMMSKVPKNFYNNMSKCSIRIAVSATPFKSGGTDKCHKFSVKGYFGPIFETKSDSAEKGILNTKKLQKKGILSKSNNTFFNIYEPELMYQIYQDAVTQGIVQNMHFHNVVKRLALKCKGRTLILVERLDHGDYLNEMIPNSLWVRGEDTLETRKEVIQKLQKQSKEDCIAIATQGIFNTGINVHLNNLINAAGGQAEHIIIQRLGRGLRTAEDKDFLNYFDFIFKINEYLLKHSNKRVKIFKKEGHEILIKDVDF